MNREFNKIPSTEHYAVLLQSTRSIFHAGDERSRTHPGHGYPAYTETINCQEYITFDNSTELKSWIIKAQEQKLNYKVFLVKPISPTIKIDISL